MTSDSRSDQLTESEQKYVKALRSGSNMRLFGGMTIVASVATGLISPWLMSKVPHNVLGMGGMMSFMLVVLAMMVYPMIMGMASALLAGLAPDRAYDRVQRNDTQVFLWVSFLVSGTSLLVIGVMPDPSGFFAFFPSPMP